jgi:hypothetical protein
MSRLAILLILILRAGQVWSARRFVKMKTWKKNLEEMIKSCLEAEATEKEMLDFLEQMESNIKAEAEEKTAAMMKIVGMGMRPAK